MSRDVDFSPAANAQRTKQARALVETYGVPRIIELAEQVIEGAQLSPAEKQAIAAYVWLKTTASVH